MDVTVPGAARDGFDILRRGWDAQVGSAIPLPPSTPIGTGDYRVRIHHSKLGDAVIEDLYSESILGGTGGDFNHLNDRIVLHVVRRGEWRFSGPRRQGWTAVPAGRFVVRHNDPSWHFEIEPRTTAKVLVLPAVPLRSLTGERALTGPSDSAEVRLLLAYATMLEETLGDMTPAGLRSASAALVELVKGVLTRGVDGSEPLLAPALVRAARDIADNRLSDSDLSPHVLARELNVSVRSLHRAFAAAEESVTAYIRRRRLEEARLALGASGGQPNVSEVAARWQFADSSHFIRAFKRQYGQTPAQYARSANKPASVSTSDPPQRVGGAGHHADSVNRTDPST